MEIKVGLTHHVANVVDESNVAAAVGSGDLPVFATPAMIAEMEKAAAQCLLQVLPQGQTSVGTAVQVEHVAATPVGATVTTVATVTAAEGRRVEFLVESRDEAGVIGTGSHTRVVVEAQRFMQKAESRQSG